MVGVLWRKRRLRLAEASALRRGIESAISSDHVVTAALAHLKIARKAIGDTTTELADLDRDEAIAVHALDLLQAGNARAYDKALGTLSGEMRRQWEELTRPRPDLGLLDFCGDQNRYSRDAEGLREFLQRQVIPGNEVRRNVLQNQPLIQDQVVGEALVADELEGLARHEIHLDRKLEHMLTMLIRLQERRDSPA
jgi:hypothetical protein